MWGLIDPIFNILPTEHEACPPTLTGYGFRMRLKPWNSFVGTGAPAGAAHVDFVTLRRLRGSRPCWPDLL
jgi:hypothetical protein